MNHPVRGTHLKRPSRRTIALGGVLVAAAVLIAGAIRLKPKAAGGEAAPDEPVSVVPAVCFCGGACGAGGGPGPGIADEFLLRGGMTGNAGYAGLTPRGGYTCTRHPGATSERPGECPVCHATLCERRAGRKPRPECACPDCPFKHPAGQ